MTPAEFQTAFPAFQNEEVATIQRHLTASAPWFDIAAWGDLYSDGLGNWIAHRIVTEEATKCMPAKEAALAGMPVVAKTVDQSVSIRYSEMLLAMTAKDPFMRTLYGQQYRYLAGIVGGGAVAV